MISFSSNPDHSKNVKLTICVSAVREQKNNVLRITAYFTQKTRHFESIFDELQK
jgi:hypothetical protein